MIPTLDAADEIGSEHAHFGLVEMDLLANYAGAEIPFPLQVPSFGQVQPERDLLLAAACETLQVRGLADDDGPLELADQLAALLGNRTGAVDLVIGGPDWNSGAVALVGPTYSVLCLQRFNDEERDLVETYAVATDTLDIELARLLPTLPGGHSIPIRLPVRAVRAAQQVLLDAEGERSDPDSVQHRLQTTLTEYGVPSAATGKLATVLHPLTGYGQMGATRPGRDGEHARVGAELSWIDTESGRMTVSTASGADGDEGWVSINPLHPDELLSGVRRLVADARR